MRDFIEFFLPLIIIFIVGFGGVFTLTHYYGQYTCGKYEQVTGRQTKWASFDDCYINDGKNWLSKEEYKAVIIAREGLITNK